MKGVITMDMVREKREKEEAKEAARRAAIEAKRPKKIKFDEELTKRYRADDLEFVPRTHALYGEGDNVRIVDIRDGIPIGFRKNRSGVLEPETQQSREPETQEAFQERQDIQEAKQKSIEVSFGDDFKPKPKPPPKQSVPALGGGTTYGQQQQTQQLLQALVAPTDVSIEAGLQTSQQLAANPLDTSLAITELPAPPPVESEVDRILRGSTLLGTSGRRTLEEEQIIEFGDD